MTRFLLRRVLQLVLVLLAVTFLVFSSLNLLGDPLVNIIGPLAAIDCTDVEAGLVEDSSSTATGIGDCEVVRLARRDYRLDEPLVSRYFLWLGDVAQGDLGTSFKNEGVPVSDIVREKLPKSLLLMVMAETIALSIAIPLGVWAAYRAGRGVDKATSLFSFVSLSIPNFALGVILLQVFSLKTGLLPSSFDDTDLFSRLHSLLLPSFALGLGIAATYQRLLRTDLLTTLQEDFVHMARAKGMPDRHVMLRHALRPSLFSLITVFGVSTGALIGGSLVIEQIFVIPGIGREIVVAVVRDDFPVVLGSVLVIAVGFVVINFLVDLLYTWLDPRVRAQ